MQYLRGRLTADDIVRRANGNPPGDNVDPLWEFHNRERRLEERRKWFKNVAWTLLALVAAYFLGSFLAGLGR